ncbi:MAG TPA: hypothetical protein PLZ36_03635, partial [Armatimonadota bacterium]|nr:hypothetical protein [Armatimonadota bacterium]
MWIISRLMWNPHQDVAVLRTHYITRAYRDAAPQLAQFYALLNVAWHDPANRQFANGHSGRGGVFKRYFVDTGTEKPARALLVAAEAAAKHPRAKLLVSRVLLQCDTWAKELGRLTVPAFPDAAMAAEAFTSPHWERATPITGFRLPRGWAKPTDATCNTEIRLMRDDEQLYARIIAYDPEPAKAWAHPRADAEQFPLSDHVELYLRSKSGTHLFALDVNGNHYDARNWDRRWHSAWRGKLRKTDHSWE